MTQPTRLPPEDRPAVIRIVTALVVGGALTLAGMVVGNPVLTIIGVGVLFVCANVTRIWYLRRRR
ncbi:hypothetical protein [Cellulomonas triticagri]|uniref:Uncharacterized protein n=1 Tax=Cellulomonas triticagri TaxID=2483352 RepID=A0A3M2JNI3_9CELL|nr:hypothetical protein [Cellulomonas triticagri]RMI13871.1 hypothetical protein EBM89_02555 [Cellulomonas triticagri]